MVGFYTSLKLGAMSYLRSIWYSGQYCHVLSSFERIEASGL